MCLPIDFVYPNPIDQHPADIHYFVSARKVQFQKAYDSARMALNFKQKRLSAIYNRKVHGPTYQVHQKVSLHNPVIPVGQPQKFFSPWKDPYVVLKCLNNVTYRIQEIATQKQLIVHYDRLKLFHEPPPASNVPTPDKRKQKNVSPLSPQQHEQIVPEVDNDQCTWHYPYQTVSTATTCSRSVACTTPTATSKSATTQVDSPKSVLPSSSSFYSGATTPYSHGSPGTPKTTIFFRSSTPTPEPPPSSAESPAHFGSFPSSSSTPSVVKSNPWLKELIDNASRILQSGDAPSQAQHQCNFRKSTTQQCKAQPCGKEKFHLT